MENLLVEIYLFVCQTYDTYSETCYQRLSNNSKPGFTDDDATIPNRPRGAGMGLAIARGIVEAHGGRIFIETGAGGRGTRVNFTVPVGDEDRATGEGQDNKDVDSSQAVEMSSTTLDQDG